MTFLKRQLPLLISFLGGISMFFIWFIAHPTGPLLIEYWSRAIQVMYGFAMFLGLLSILRYSYIKIKRKVPGWGYSIAVFVGFIIMGTLGAVFGVAKDTPVGVDYKETHSYTSVFRGNFASIFKINVQEAVDKARDEWNVDQKNKADRATLIGDSYKTIPFHGHARVDNPFQNWMYKYLLQNLAATMFALLSFYIASAAFRAFRAKSFEATALLVTGIIVMIGNVTAGEFVSHWLRHDLHLAFLDFAQWTNWILNGPNIAAQRAITFGLFLGQMALALRIIFGIERTYLGGGD